MKKNLFLRLCLMMVVVLSFNSCRQDLLPEQETYHNTSAFQLTSKRISLNEAKHKAKLLPELEKADAEFKKIKTNTFGKTVNYGNGVSIDTDDVIYIENGPNYHTYTFRINRENVPAGAPVENLVLSPMSDGSYKELLVTYNLTSQEKQTLANGGFVDTEGKSETVELENGTFDSAGLLNRVSCRYVEEVRWTRCSSDDHGESNVGACNYWTQPGGTPPQPYIVLLYRCDFLPVLDTDLGSSGGNTPTTEPGGGGSEGNNNNPPAECDDPVLQNPQDIDLNSGENPCGNGIVTQPSLPNSKDDNCKQLQSLKDKAGFSEKMITLKNNVENGAKEKGFVMHDDNTTPTSSVIEGGSPHDPADVNFEPYYNSIDINLLYKTYGSAHNHLKNNPKHIGVPTPEDFNSLLLYGLIETNPQNPNHISTPKKAIVLVTTKIGLFALKINDLTKMKAYISKYMLMTDEKKKDYVKKNFFNSKKYNILPSSTHDQQVTGFLRFLKDMEVGADMYEGNPINNGDWKKLNLVENTNGTYSYTQTPCNL